MICDRFSRKLAWFSRIGRSLLLLLLQWYVCTILDFFFPDFEILA